MNPVLENKTDMMISEVYASDILQLKAFLNALQGKSYDEPLTKSFGIPFLQFVKEGRIIGFASTIVNEKNKVDFILYQKKTSDSAFGKEIQIEVEKRFMEKQLSAFQDVKSLENNISCLLNWLNHNCN